MHNIPCAFCEPSLTDGVPVYEERTTVRTFAVPSGLAFHQFSDIIDAELEKEQGNAE